MNEPGAAHLLVLVAALGAVLSIPTVVIAVCARRLSDSAWNHFVVAAMVVAAAGVLASFFISDANPADARLYRGLVVALTVSSGIAALVASRSRRQYPGIPFRRLLSTTASTQLLVSFLVMMASC
jgi:hypothetical protein